MRMGTLFAASASARISPEGPAPTCATIWSLVTSLHVDTPPTIKTAGSECDVMKVSVGVVWTLCATNSCVEYSAFCSWAAAPTNTAFGAESPWSLLPYDKSIAFATGSAQPGGRSSDV
jgi:hypothetical protein